MVLQVLKSNQATAANAFGGSREALMAAENERNKNLAMNNIIGQGYNTAFQNAQQAQQFGANLGLQGGQAALAGLGQAQSAASTLGNLGTAQLGAEQNVIGTQAQQGLLQQQNQQNMINQAIQNYATAQQYPLMELGTMSNMLRGLPMQASTTQMYQAQPSLLTQGIGAAGALGSLIQASNTGKAEGGVVEAAQGGIMSFDVGGAVKAQLEKMPTEKLNELKNTTSSQSEKADIMSILSERAMGQIPEAASGGILAFADGDKVEADDPYGAMYSSDLDQALAKKQYELNLANKPATTPSMLMTPKASPQQFDVAGLMRQAGIGPGGYTQTENPSLTDAQVAAKAKADADAKALLAAKNANVNAQPGLPGTSGMPKALAADYNKTPEDIEKAIHDKYAAEVLHGPMSDEGKKIFDSYQTKIDDAKSKEDQRFWLHSAAFFANLGTHTGSTVVAALQALKDEIPNYVKDKDEQEKHLEELSKAQYEISNAELLKRQGLFKAAQDEKDKTIGRIAEVYKANVEAMKPSSEVQLINAAMKNPAFKETLMDVKQGPADIRAASKLREDYDKWIAAGNTGTIDEYARTHTVGSSQASFDPKTVSLVQQYLNNAKK